MNKRQTNRYRMILNTQAALDANSSLWNTFSVILTPKNNLDEIILRVIEQNEKAMAGTQSITADKTSTREGLARKVEVVSGILQAYASITGNNAIIDSISVNRTDVVSARETDVDALVTPVINYARAELANLADYGISEAMILETETSLDQFNSLIGNPRTVRNQAYAALATLQELIDSALDILNDRLDKLMLRFKYTHPGFYDEYMRARVIVD